MNHRLTRKAHTTGAIGNLNPSWTSELAPFFLYLAASFLFFGRGLCGDSFHNFTNYHIGTGPDPNLMMWCLVWWPHAIVRHLNPFITQALWAPSGFNLTWTTSIPLVAVLAAPLTALAGPVATLNILCLVSLPISAWCAFLLCRYLTGDYWASVLGGYIFGFSPPALGEIHFTHLHAILLFPIPLAVYLVVRRFNGELSTPRFITFLVLTLTAELLLSVEIFATLTIVGGIVLALAWLLGQSWVRTRLNAILLPIAVSFCVVGIIASPFFYFFLFSPRMFAGSVWSNLSLSADLLNFVVPAPINEIGVLHWFEHTSIAFNMDNRGAAIAYLSWPLIVIVFLYAREHWREPVGKILVDSLVIVLVLSLGPLLHIDGNVFHVGLPGVLFNLSILKNAAPGRLSIYVGLILGLIAAYWFSLKKSKGWRISIGGLVLLFFLPNLVSAYWIRPVHREPFFSKGLYKDYLAKNENVLILPFYPLTRSLLWQAETGMYFRMAGGTGPWPAKQAWPIVEAFQQRTYVPDARAQLEAYLASCHVSSIILSNRSYMAWRHLVDELGARPSHVGGVWIYRGPFEGGQSVNPTLSGMTIKYDADRFSSLLIAVKSYLHSGGNVKQLSAQNIVKLGLVPTSSLIGLPGPPRQQLRFGRSRIVSSRYGIWLFVERDDVIALGEDVSGPGSKRIINEFGGIGAKRSFIAPDTSNPKAKNSSGVLLMFFDREQLAKAAAIAAKSMRESSTVESTASFERSQRPAYP